MKRIYVGLFVGILFLFFIYKQSALLSCVVYPFLKIHHTLVEPFSAWWNKKTMLHELEKEYRTLFAEYEKVFAENISLKGAQNYLHDTHELINFTQRYDAHNCRIKQILARHLSEHNQFFLVDGGVSQGIKKDMIALYNNCLIGKVTEVYPWYCKVSLLTDATCKVSAVCSNSGVKGILEGTNNSKTMTLNYVSHLNSLDDNDIILSTGEGLIFPRGFGLGKITKVEKDELLYTISVTPLLDFELLQYCIICAKNEVENGAL